MQRASSAKKNRPNNHVNEKEARMSIKHRRNKICVARNILVLRLRKLTLWQCSQVKREPSRERTSCPIPSHIIPHFSTPFYSVSLSLFPPLSLPFHTLSPISCLFLLFTLCILFFVLPTCTPFSWFFFLAHSLIEPPARISLRPIEHHRKKHRDSSDNFPLWKRLSRIRKKEESRNALFTPAFTQRIWVSYICTKYRWLDSSLEQPRWYCGNRAIYLNLLALKFKSLRYCYFILDDVSQKTYNPRCFSWWNIPFFFRGYD